MAEGSAGFVRVAGFYSFNRGREDVEGRYANLLEEIKDVIGAVDASKYKIKASKEKTMPGRMLFDPRSINRAFKAEFLRRGWSPVRVGRRSSAGPPGFWKLVSGR